MKTMFLFIIAVELAAICDMLMALCKHFGLYQ